jgi:hypothetical protein
MRRLRLSPHTSLAGAMWWCGSLSPTAEFVRGKRDAERETVEEASHFLLAINELVRTKLRLERHQFFALLEAVLGKLGLQAGTGKHQRNRPLA